jgi:hypothetical protein
MFFGMGGDTYHRSLAGFQTVAAGNPRALKADMRTCLI